MSQLTINLDDNVLQTLRYQAHQQGQELESWVARLLQAAALPMPQVPPAEPAPSRPLSPRIQRLFGAVQVPADFDYKKALEEAIQERYKL